MGYHQIQMVHRTQDIRSFCADCELEAHSSCPRCSIRFCADHKPKRGERCRRCEQEYGLVVEKFVASDRAKLFIRRKRSKVVTRVFLFSFATGLWACAIALTETLNSSLTTACLVLGLMLSGVAAFCLPFVLWSGLGHLFFNKEAHLRRERKLKGIRKKFLRSQLKGKRLA